MGAIAVGELLGAQFALAALLGVRSCKLGELVGVGAVAFLVGRSVIAIALGELFGAQLLLCGKGERMGVARHRAGFALGGEQAFRLLAPLRGGGDGLRVKTILSASASA